MMAILGLLLLAVNATKTNETFELIGSIPDPSRATDSFLEIKNGSCYRIRPLEMNLQWVYHMNQPFVFPHEDGQELQQIFRFTDSGEKNEKGDSLWYISPLLASNSYLSEYGGNFVDAKVRSTQWTVLYGQCDGDSVVRFKSNLAGKILQTREDDDFRVRLYSKKKTKTCIRSTWIVEEASCQLPVPEFEPKVLPKLESGACYKMKSAWDLDDLFWTLNGTERHAQIIMTRHRSRVFNCFKLVDTGRTNANSEALWRILPMHEDVHGQCLMGVNDTVFKAGLCDFA